MSENNSPGQMMKQLLLGKISSDVQSILEELAGEAKAKYSILPESEKEKILSIDFERAAMKAGQSVLTWFKAMSSFPDSFATGVDLELVAQARNQLVIHVMCIRDWFRDNNPEFAVGNVEFEELFGFLSRNIENELTSFVTRSSGSIAIKPREGSSVVPINSTDLRVLFVAADPVKREALRLYEEARVIKDRLRKGSHRDLIWFDNVWASQLEDVTAEVNRFRPKVVHMSGHGSAAAGFVFLDKNGQPMPATGKNLRRMFLAFGNDTQLVVFCCCNSARHAEELTQVVDFVIGFDCVVNDEDAIAFSSEFYGALSFGRDLEQSFNQALGVLEAMRAKCLPILYTKEGLWPAAGQFIKVKNPVDFTSLANAVNELASDLFRNGERCLRRIRDNTRSMTGLQGASGEISGVQSGILGSALAINEIMSLFEVSVERSAAIQRVWQDALSAEAISDLQALGASCLNIRLELLKQWRTMEIFQRLAMSRTQENGSGNWLDPTNDLSSLLPGLAKLIKTALSLIAIHFDKLVQGLPAEVSLAVKFKNWKWEG